MVNIEKYLPYIIIGGLGAAVLYYLSTKPALGGAAAPMVVEVKPGVQGNLLQRASQQLGIPQSELVVRGLRPQDLGLVTWDITSVGAGWTSVANTAVADNTFISFDGCSYGGTNFTQMRIQAGARYMEYWPLTFITGLESQLWYDDSPSIAQQNQSVIIDVYAKAGATETINLMGTVVERRGMVIA